MANMDNFKNIGNNTDSNEVKSPVNSPINQPISTTVTNDTTLSASSDSKTLTKKKKRSKLFIIVEVVLMLVVVILILMFLNGSGIISLKFLNFSSSNTTTPATKTSDSKTSNSNDDWSAEVVTPTPPSLVAPGSREAMELASSPRLSLPVPAQSAVSSEDQIPAGAIKVYGTEFGFEPFEFTVQAGAEVILALVSQVDVPTILTFYDPNMPAIAIGCGPRETRWITFNAPSQPGEYVFKNDAIGRNTQTGRMIVN